MKRTTVEEFDPDGKLVKRTVTEEEEKLADAMSPWPYRPVCPHWPHPYTGDPEPWKITWYWYGPESSATVTASGSSI